MGRLGLFSSLCAAALVAAACGGAKAQVLMPDAVPLAMPAAPSRVVVPAAPQPPPTATEPPVQAANPPATAPGSAARPIRDTPPPRPVTPPTAPPTTPPVAAAVPTPLETTPNPGELEQRARALVSSAKITLEKIDYKALSTDGQAQYNTAKRFLEQADDALKAKNVVYAWQLADKANTIATLLR